MAIAKNVRMGDPAPGSGGAGRGAGRPTWSATDVAEGALASILAGGDVLNDLAGAACGRAGVPARTRAPRGARP